MVTCRSCGQENPDGFRFCGACAAPLSAEAPTARDEQKIVTTSRNSPTTFEVARIQLEGTLN